MGTEPNGNDGVPEHQEIEVAFAEDLPQKKGGIQLMFSACHEIRAMHAGWDAEKRILAMFCSECGTVVKGVKVESKGRIVKV